MRHPAVRVADQAAAMLTAAGLPRMPARTLMALVASPDEGYTAAQLAERLGVSPAAISGAVRYLTSLRMIEKVSRPGERLARYEMVDDGWHAMVVANAPLYGRLADAIDEIADENADAQHSVARAREVAGFLRFLQTRMPELVEEWWRSREG
ncbi:GbsR/MarR family transcriptional regulator [Herbiconiux sp. A18JL235]|uniref:GbsR/MarR family transcriptional regulator n=1 Tax=Herbiconiux sp. A18JL235 TaxID=3152363 RepID=A0AB39BE25_9MICO